MNIIDGSCDDVNQAVDATKQSVDVDAVDLHSFQVGEVSTNLREEEVEATDQGEGDTEFILINNKVYVLYNHASKKVMVIDNKKLFCNRMRRKIFAWAAITDEHKSEFGFTYALIELSYADNRDWSSKDITSYVQKVMKEVGKENIYDYAWVFEIKPKGRNLHYHLAMHIDKRVYIPFPDAEGFWSKGSTHIYRGRSNPYYLCKYLKKYDQKIGSEFPRGCRKYNTWLNGHHYSERALWDLKKASYPASVGQFCDDMGWVNARVNRAVGGGYEVRPAYSMLGEDEFTFYIVGSDWEFMRKGDYEVLYAEKE